MAFDLARIADGACAEGNLEADPIYNVVMRIHQHQSTGRLTIVDAAGPNHMYFMQGRPVGVALAEYIHPLGQLLLELGRINGATFVQAQRLIARGNRLAGQAFKELGVLDEQSLRDVLAIQARKKAEHLCRLNGRSFVFCNGLTYLSGFNSAPLDVWVVVYLGVRAQLGPEARAAWIDGIRNEHVCITRAAGDVSGLPAAPAAFGFGAAEERFVQRILGSFEKFSALCDTGTLPADDAAVLLRFMEVLGRLERRKVPAPVPVPVSGSMPVPVTAPGPPSVSVSSRVQTSASAPVTAPPQASPPLPRKTSLPSAGTEPARPAGTPPPPARAMKPTPRAAPVSSDVFAGPNETTGPRPAATREARAEAPSQTASAVEPNKTAKERLEPFPESRRFRSIQIPDPAQNAPPPPALGGSEPTPTDIEGSAPVVRTKKKVRRSEPLPSQGSGVLVSETRKEKTNVGPMPSIVIEDD